MDIEKALTILADKHHRYLWREEGKGWGFVSSTGTSTSNIFSTITEAILFETKQFEDQINSYDAQITTVNLAKNKVQESLTLLKAD
jgi:hypothetical protein